MRLSNGNTLTVKGRGVARRHLTRKQKINLAVGLMSGSVHLDQLSLAQALAVVPNVSRRDVRQAIREHRTNGK